MIQYYAHSNNYLEMCRCYRALYESEGITEDAAQWTPVRQQPPWQGGSAATMAAAAAAGPPIAGAGWEGRTGLS
jgi:hypothetical protein